METIEVGNSKGQAINLIDKANKIIDVAIIVIFKFLLLTVTLIDPLSVILSPFQMQRLGLKAAYQTGDDIGLIIYYTLLKIGSQIAHKLMFSKNFYFYLPKLTIALVDFLD